MAGQDREIAIDLNGKCILCYKSTRLPHRSESVGGYTNVSDLAWRLTGPSDHEVQNLCDLLNLNPSPEKLINPELAATTGEDAGVDDEWKIKAVTCPTCSKVIQTLQFHLRKSREGFEIIHGTLSETAQQPNLEKEVYVGLRDVTSKFQFSFVSNLRQALMSNLVQDANAMMSVVVGEATARVETTNRTLSTRNVGPGDDADDDVSRDHDNDNDTGGNDSENDEIVISNVRSLAR